MDALLREPEVDALVEVYGRDAVRVQAGELLDRWRRDLAAAIGGGADSAGEAGAGAAPSVERRLAALPEMLAAALAARFSAPARKVLNATGVFLHTNLGRAPLPAEVIGGLAERLAAGCDLEFDLERGDRGDRAARVTRLLGALAGADAALAVNNAAAGLWLALASRAAGREVVVSRGELVEIGGSFRIPEILATAGARLVEVGTTNRTRLADYERAIGAGTALLLKVLPSNYRVEGFVASVGAEELARLGARHGVPLLVDEGSGLVRPHPAAVFRRHPSIRELLGQGAALVVASGDKLLGGPQAGLVLGDRAWVAMCREHPLYRALRPGRLTLVALESTLRRHLRGEPMPLDDLWPEPRAHRERLERFLTALGGEPGLAERLSIAASDAYVGGGSAPEEPIPGDAVAVREAPGLSAALRLGTPAVLASERRQRLWLDLRTVASADDAALATAVRQAFRRSRAGRRPGAAGRVEPGG